jgi:drug/metabolite transporter (DMT)-like permease
MLVGIVIGVAGLAIVAVAYSNRNELSEKSGARLWAPYALGAVVSMRLA